MLLSRRRTIALMLRRSIVALTLIVWRMRRWWISALDTYVILWVNEELYEEAYLLRWVRAASTILLLVRRIAMIRRRSLIVAMLLLAIALIITALMLLVSTSVSASTTVIAVIRHCPRAY